MSHHLASVLMPSSTTSFLASLSHSIHEKPATSISYSGYTCPGINALWVALEGNLTLPDAKRSSASRRVD